MTEFVVTLKDGPTFDKLGHFTFDQMPNIGHHLALEGFSGFARVVAVVHRSGRVPYTELVVEAAGI